MLEEKKQELALAVYEILSDVYDQSPWTFEQVLTDLSQAEVDYLFAYEGSEIVGFLSLQQLVGELELTNLAVKSIYQGQGFAKQLMSDLQGIDLPIFLEVRASNLSAQALYQAFGFEVIAKRRAYYHEPVEDALIMKREGNHDR